MRFSQRFRSAFHSLLCATLLVSLSPLTAAQTALGVKTPTAVPSATMPAVTTTPTAAPISSVSSVTAAPTNTAAASPAPSAVAAPAPNIGGNLLQLIVGLAVVLALMVGALWLIKQLTQRRGAASGLLKVVTATAVGPRERVVIVEVGSTWLVLGVAPGRVTPLAEVPRQATTNPATNTTNNATTAETRRPTAADFLRRAGGGQP